MVKYQSQTIRNCCNQTRYVSKGACMNDCHPPTSLGNNKDKKHLCDLWHGMSSCESPSCCTVNQKTECIGTSKQKVRIA